MSSRFLSMLAAVLLSNAAAEARDLRVCADPDNLPFSNMQEQGFENRILRLLAKDMGVQLAYVWSNERRATAVELMNKGRCDLVPGAIAGAPALRTTTPYMRSSYAFVTRADSEVSGLDDPKLGALQIGVQSVGDDAVTPPVEALLRRGLNANLRPYTLHGSAADPNTARGIVRAVAARDIDAAVLWGPFAGYFAAEQAAPLRVRLVSASPEDPQMRFDVSMAVRVQDGALQADLDRALAARRQDIEAILAGYHVPILPMESSP